MVFVTRPFDLGGELGKGIGQGLGLIGQREFAKSGLEALERLDPADFENKPLFQQLAILGKSFAGTPIQNQFGDIATAYLKERQRTSDLKPSDIRLPSAGGAEAYDKLNDAGKQLYNDLGRVSAQDRTGSVGKPDPEPYTDQENVKEGLFESQKAIDPIFQTRFKDIASAFPNASALYPEGNPQGLNYEEQLELAQKMINKGSRREDAIQRVQDYSNYLRERYQILQDLQNQATEASRAKYGNTEFAEMMQRVAQNTVKDLVKKGQIEPNSVLNATLQKQKLIDTAINRVKDQKGRPFFEIELDKRKSETGNWLAPIIQAGEYQTAVELAMKNSLPTQIEGQRVNGPDWGPVRATEIVQERGNPNGKRKLEKFADKIDLSISNLSKDPFIANIQLQQRSATAPGKGAENRKQQYEKIEDFIVNQLNPQDSLTLLRAYLLEKGVEENDFDKILDRASERRGGNFSDYQNWERSALLPYNVRPSLYELLNGYRPIGAKITGKI